MANGENLIKIQELSPRHKQVASLLAQGLDRTAIAELVEYTPEYVTWLTRDPLFKQYLAEMSEHVEARFEALFEKSADVVAQQMQFGSGEEQLKAARLQLEVTGRIGKNDRPSTASDQSIERLATLANRLTGLLSQARQGQIIDSTAREVTPDNEMEAA